MLIKEIEHWIAAKTSRNDSGLWLPLWMHAQDTAEIMVHLWNQWLPDAVRQIICDGKEEALLKKTCRFLGLTHDMGKATAAFQSRILCSLPEIKNHLTNKGLIIPELAEYSHSGQVTHALAAEAILKQLAVRDCICEIAGAHHGKPQDYETVEYSLESHGYHYYASQKDVWIPLWQTFLENAVQKSGLESAKVLPQLSVKAQVLLSGLLVMADWIASNTKYFPLIAIDEMGSETLYPQRIKKGWKDAALPDFWTAEEYFWDEEIFKERFTFSPNPVQQAVLETAQEIEAPGLLIMEAQMGVGKTEAALAAAEIFAGKRGCGGLFFGLPTQATANGIFPRLRDWAQKQSEKVQLSIRLAHGKAELNEDYTDLFTGEAQIGSDEDPGLVVHQFFLGRKQSLLSDFVIATVDQILMAALKQKHLMLRHLGMAGKVVIIDECHAYDAYMNVYLDRALNWMGAYHVPVILLSATLPADRRRDLMNAYLNRRSREIKADRGEWTTSRAYPLLTWTDGKGVNHRDIPMENTSKSVHMEWIKDSRRIPVLREKLQRGGCALVILSTVKRAQEFALEVRENIPDARVLLLHAAFLMPDRAQQEQEILQRLGKKSREKDRDHLIVIGTSVLEQSLDIDADFMITDLCPMDLLLQRLGRLHRHPVHDAERPEILKEALCCISEPDDEEYEGGAAAIYGQYLLMRTKARLPEQILLPKDIPDLVQDCYGDWEYPTPDPQYSKAKQEDDVRKGTLKSKAKTYRLEKPSDCDALDGWISNVDTSLTTEEAEATVRDGEYSLEVLVFIKKEEGLFYLPWQNKGRAADTDRLPSAEERRELLKQRIKLPGALCQKGNIRSTLMELEEIRKPYLLEWSYDPALRDELMLLLDDNLHAELGGFHLTYSQTEGLMSRKGEKQDGTGI